MKTLNSKLDLTEKLKEIKIWAQVKSPKPLQSALSYALDWLSPELLGTGFRIFEISDFELKATIPALKANFDSQNEIHQGLVTNAVLELVKILVQRHLPENFFQMIETDLKLHKKQRWTEDLTLSLKTSEVEMDEFFVELQKFKKSHFEFEVKIQTQKKGSEKFKKTDLAFLKVTIETTALLT